MSVEKQLARVMFFAMRNRSVARYIPLDKLREQLKDTLGDKCDVCEIIESYLELNSLMIQFVVLFVLMRKTMISMSFVNRFK